MGRRTQQRRRKRVEEFLALRHDEREFRRRWLARVDAWCKGLRGIKGAEGARASRTDEVIRSVLKELGEIGEPDGSPLAMETRRRLEAATRQGVAP